jgi:hypothetical protein
MMAVKPVFGGSLMANAIGGLAAAVTDNTQWYPPTTTTATMTNIAIPELRPTSRIIILTQDDVKEAISEWISKSFNDGFLAGEVYAGEVRVELMFPEEALRK